MGGVSILLFGIIAASGLRMMIDSKIDFGINRNLVIASVILVVGIGGAFIEIEPLNDLRIEGMALASILGILLNLLLPGNKEGENDMFEEAGQHVKTLKPKYMHKLKEN